MFALNSSFVCQRLTTAATTKAITAIQAIEEALTNEKAVLNEVIAVPTLAIDSINTPKMTRTGPIAAANKPTIMIVCFVASSISVKFLTVSAIQSRSEERRVGK